MDHARRSLFSQLAGSAASSSAQKEIRINGNENPVGPGPQALQSVLAEMGEANRYPFNSRLGNLDILEALAAGYEVAEHNVVVGSGSTEILRNAVREFASPDRHIVSANLTYGTPASEARKHGFPLHEIPLDDALRLDLDAMQAVAENAGLLYLCNPNNPTGTIHPADTIEAFIGEVRKTAPECLILVDEAYHDYVTDPRHRSMIPVAVRTPNVLVCRTFSKAFGIAGLRLGFGIGDENTIAALRRYQSRGGLNIMAIAAAVASLQDPDRLENERARNTAAREATVSFFQDAGYELTDSQANFLFVKLGIPAKEFRDACAAKGVVVGRDFPPYEKTHCRISIGTMAEMQRAFEVFSEVLDIPSTKRSA
jgi:histidinol-phosphate aminotransferase